MLLEIKDKNYVKNLDINLLSQIYIAVKIQLLAYIKIYMNLSKIIIIQTNNKNHRRKIINLNIYFIMEINNNNKKYNKKNNQTNIKIKNKAK